MTNGTLHRTFRRQEATAAVVVSLLAFALVLGRAERADAEDLRMATPFPPIVVSGVQALADGSVAARGAEVRAAGGTFRADATWRRAGDREAFMVRSEAAPLPLLLPAADRFLGRVFATAGPGQLALAVTTENGEATSYELTWRSERTWLIDIRDTRSLGFLRDLVTDSSIFDEWDFAHFLVESAAVRVRRVENVYGAEDAARHFGASNGDRHEYVADITLEGTMPAARGLFRWLRTRVTLRAPNFPLRLVAKRLSEADPQESSR